MSTSSSSESPCTCFVMTHYSLSWFKRHTRKPSTHFFLPACSYCSKLLDYDHTYLPIPKPLTRPSQNLPLSLRGELEISKGSQQWCFWDSQEETSEFHAYVWGDWDQNETYKALEDRPRRSGRNGNNKKDRIILTKEDDYQQRHPRDEVWGVDVTNYKQVFPFFLPLPKGDRIPRLSPRSLEIFKTQVETFGTLSGPQVRKQVKFDVIESKILSCTSLTWCLLRSLCTTLLIYQERNYHDKDQRSKEYHSKAQSIFQQQVSKRSEGVVSELELKLFEDLLHAEIQSISKRFSVIKFIDSNQKTMWLRKVPLYF